MAIESNFFSASNITRLFFAKYKNFCNFFLFKFYRAVYGIGNLPNGDPFSQKHRLRPCQPGTLSLSTASQHSHIIRAKLCLTLNYKPLV